MRLSRLTIPMLAVAAIAAGCAERREPAPVVYRGTEPASAQAARQPSAPTRTAALPAVRPNAAGVVDYGGYRAVVAQPGDTIASMAARVGLSPSALASYNGLPSGYQPKPGDELILPPAPSNVGTVETAALAPPEPAPQQPVAEPAPAAVPTPAAPEETTRPLNLDEIEASIGGQAAPAAEPETEQAAAAPAPAPVEAPPPAPEPAAPVPPVAEPEPAPQPQTAAFVKPVEGPVARAYSRNAGGGRNDGVDFAAAPGAAVRAAADGQVALVSESLGGLKTIVLIRHANDLLTVYGRLGEVSVAKGDRVRKGETIGTVAPPDGGGDALLHFEVRRGAESVDPANYLPS